MQTLLALASLVMVMAFALNMYRSTANVQQRLAVGEVATQLVGVGTEVLDYLGTRGFDANAQATESNPLPISSPNELTPAADFGTNRCNLTFADGGYTEDGPCTYLENFHGTTLPISWGGFTFTVSIRIRYVNPLVPNDSSAVQTYAKEARVTVENPNLRIGDAPARIPLTRVFTYQKNTTSL